MDPSAIATLAGGLIPLLRPYFSKAAGKAAEKAGEALPAALGNLWTNISKRVSETPSGKEALSDLAQTPDDADAHAAFRIQLRKLLERDPALATEAATVIRSTESYRAQVVGDGAIAQGDGAQAFGAGSTVTFNEREKDRR
jgi:hypothetical protein